MLRLSPLPAVLVASLTLAYAQATNSPPTAPAEADVPPLATAILDFQTSDSSLATPPSNGAATSAGGSGSQEGTQLAALLEADMSGKPHATMVERQDIDKILSEQELGASGLVTADTAAKIGSLTGAQVLVTGRIFMVGNNYMVVAKIISTETSRVYGVTSTLNDLAKLPDAAQDLAGKIDAALESHHDVLVVQEETPQERLQRLKTILGGRSLPTVSVNISEHDYTQPTIDPAAQTEIMHDLQELGFTVLASNQELRKPDVVITGEAFSELGTRHGNLVSSRGRVEITAQRRSTRELLWTDKETRVAVDVGDRSAGKQAIDKAASVIVERLLPKLTK